VQPRNHGKPGTARFGSALPRCTFFPRRRSSHMLLNQRGELRADFPRIARGRFRPWQWRSAVRNCRRHKYFEPLGRQGRKSGPESRYPPSRAGVGHAAPPRRPVTPGWRLWHRANVLTVEFLEVVPETSCLAAQVNNLISSSADRMDMTTRNIVGGLQGARGLRARAVLPIPVGLQGGE
jgi:hypothetical protein